MDCDEGTATTVAEQIFNLEALAMPNTVPQPQPDHRQTANEQFEETLYVADEHQNNINLRVGSNSINYFFLDCSF